MIVSGCFLTGDPSSGDLVVVTRTDSVGLTAEMVLGADDDFLLLWGCARAELRLPPGTDPQRPFPLLAVDLSFHTQCSSVRWSGGRVSVLLTARHLADDPILLLATDPIAGWPL